MSRFLVMLYFHIRQYFLTRFVLLLVGTSTSSMLLLQYLVRYDNGQTIGKSEMLLAAVFGMWSCTVTSAGSLYFQRTQGVLIYLINSGRPAVTNLLVVVSASATFGLLAFPIAYFEVGLLASFSWPVVQISAIFLIVLFWLGPLTISYLLALLFLFTRNAFVYESLLVMPVMILVGLPTNQMGISKFSWWLPIWYPVQLLQREGGYQWLESLAG